jgi:serine/threonine protein kinase
MNPNVHKVRSIFLAAVENHTPEQWNAYLDEACADDDDLRRRVEGLLRGHAESNSLLDRPGAALLATMDEQISERPGTVIGAYKLLEQIGEGGFGVVFMAEQQHPIRRKVALKVLKPGMDTKQVVVRFEAERQALALMDHPNIAHVFDGGTTREPGCVSAGRPYFVMELVRGISLTDYCDQNNLPIHERLELFVNVCQAVQHAHQKGIIHRDIKPSNILVTLHDGVPVPKVIDFGIAKASGMQLTEKTLFTNFAQMIGTPLYMSPEQAEMSGLDIDTRSDIYSLGVLLYELLTGETPFDKERLRHAGFDEIRRIIQEEEPPKPSRRMSTVGEAATTASTRRQSDPRKLSRLFRGELDWIVMKALEKDRNRRYETAGAFIVDVQCYLHDEPVQACPPSTFYRFRKFTWRYRAALATAALLLIMLVAGVVFSAYQAIRAHEAGTKALQSESKALREAAKAKAINDFLINDLLHQASPFDNPVGDKITVRVLLDKAAEKIDNNEAIAAEPEVEAAIRHVIGDTYGALALFEEAEKHSSRALNIRRKVLGPKHADTLSTMSLLGRVLFLQGKFVEAEEICRQSLADLRDELGGGHADTLHAMFLLASALQLQGKLDEAEPLFREAYETRRRVQGADDFDTLRAGIDLAGLLFERGRLDDAEPLIQQNLNGQRRAGRADDHPDMLVALEWTPILLQARGKWDEAEREYRKVDKVCSRVLGAAQNDTISNLQNLAVLLHARGKWFEAESIFRRIVPAFRKVQPKHPYTALILYAWGNFLLDKGESKDAERALTEALLIQRKTLVKDHCCTGQTLAALGWAVTKNGRAEEGELLLREGLDICQRKLPKGDWFTADTESLLGGCLTAQRQFGKAEPLLLAGYNDLLAAAGNPPVISSWPIRCTLNLQPSPGAPPMRIQQALNRIVTLYETWGNAEQAGSWRAKRAELEKNLGIVGQP